MEKYKNSSDSITGFFQKRIRNFYAMIFFILLTPFLMSCVSGGGPDINQEVALKRTSFSFDTDKAPYNVFPEYRLKPGDMLDVLFQIHTWTKKEFFKISVDNTVTVKFVNNPELDQKQLVRPDGAISLPYIGSVKVVGKTVEELTKELKFKYSKILQEPELYVVVPEFRSAIKELKTDLHTAPRGLSRLVTIRPDGYVTFPLVGDLYAASKTIPELSKELNHDYEKILQDLHCDLFLQKHSGAFIYVLGEVKKPGIYKIEKPISVFEALARAGSYERGANLNSVFVIRRHAEKMIATRLNMENTMDLSKGSKFFFLQPDDIIYVPKTWLATASDVARKIGDVIFFRGWGFGVGFTWELNNNNNY
jgi:polysaccharide export outer membrane protein